MKRAAILLAAAMMISATTPVFAAEHGDMKMNMDKGMTMDTKEGVRQCALQAESIQQKIKRLKAEIKKGKKEHSAEDLKMLETKLKEANDLLDNLNKP